MIRVWFGILVGLGLAAIFILLLHFSSWQPVESEDWFAFSLPWDDGTSTYISANLETPAGKHGFVKVSSDGDFFFQDGSPARFWGVVLNPGLLCPPKEVAEKLASRLGKFGINLVRIVGLDRVLIDPDLNDTRHFDKSKLDRFDYLVKELKENGIYIDILLIVLRRFRSEDGVIDWNASEFVGNWEKRRLLLSTAFFDPYVLSLQKEWAQKLLSHRNPYTGNRYSQEPAVAMLEIINETSLTYGWLRDFLNVDSPEPIHITSYYSKELDVLWNLWLSDHYKTREALASAWEPKNKDREGLLSKESFTQGNVRRILYSNQDQYSKARLNDLLTFYNHLEEEYFKGFRNFLKEKVGVKIPVSGTHTFHGMANQSVQAQMDFTGAHTQWEHPILPRDRPGSIRILNTPMVKGESASIPYKADWIETKNTLYRMAFGMSVKDKPLVVSEYNHAFPNEYQAEFPLLLSSYSAFQDWDGIMIHSYGPNPEGLKESKIQGLFYIHSNPAIMAQMPVASLLFRKGYVREAQETKVVNYSKSLAYKAFLNCGLDIYCVLEMREAKPEVTLVHQVRNKFTHKSNETSSSPHTKINGPPYISDTEELMWDQNQGLVVINTDYVQVAVGFLGGRSIKLKNMTIQSQTDFAAISLISMDGEPIPNSEKLLLTAVSRAKNQDMKINKDLLGFYLLKDWGHGPVMVQDVKARIKLDLANSKAKQVLRLDKTGKMDVPLPVTLNEGKIKFKVGGRKTLWYGITDSSSSKSEKG